MDTEMLPSPPPETSQQASQDIVTSVTTPEGASPPPTAEDAKMEDEAEPESSPSPSPTTPSSSVHDGEDKPPDSTATKTEDVPPVRRSKTVRLDITLGGPDNYAVNVRELTLATGQRETTPPPVKQDSSDSEDEGENAEGGAGTVKRRRKRRYYDLNDPFIDDTDLAIDERTHIGITKQHGFYVCSGDVGLMKDPNAASPRKPKSRKVPQSIAPVSKLLQNAPTLAGVPVSPSVNNHTSVAGHGAGTRDSPIALDGEEQAAPNTLKRKGSAEPTADGATNGRSVKRARGPFIPSPDLTPLRDALLSAIATADFSVKGRFPQEVKPVLWAYARKAIELGEYTDAFFDDLPTIFLYNRFTMMKLVKRNMFEQHKELLAQNMENVLKDLKSEVDAGFEKAKEDHVRAVANFERRKAEKTPHPPQPGGPSETSTPMPDDHPPSEEEDGGGGRGNVPPQQKYRLTRRMREIIWELVLLSNESARIDNEKRDLDKSSEPITSEQGLRKILYQRIVSAFPEGWMNSGYISREVSILKKKFEKNAMTAETAKDGT